MYTQLWDGWKGGGQKNNLILALSLTDGAVYWTLFALSLGFML